MNGKVPLSCMFCEHQNIDRKRYMIRCSIIEESYKYNTEAEQYKHCPLVKHGKEINEVTE